MEKLKTGQRIRFRSISYLSGKELELSGIILGNAEAVRKFWPEEMAEAKGCYLVRREDSFGNTFHHAVFPEEVL